MIRTSTFMSGIIAATLSIAAFSVGAQEERQPVDVLLHIGFDGDLEAHAPGAEVVASEIQPVAYAEGRVGQAGDFIETGCVEYRGLPALDLEQGTIELWIKPAHPPTELEDHCYLQFLSEDGSAGIEIKFYHVELSVQVTMWGAGGKFRRYGWGFEQNAWQHIVVTWDAVGPAPSGLTLYKQGAETGYPRSYKPIDQPSLLRVGCLSREGDQQARALIDEITVYDRALTAGQVRVLYQAADRPLAERLAVLRERIAADEALAARRRDLLFNHRRIAILHGRNTSLLNWPDSRFEALQLPVPEPVHEDTLATVDLSVYDVLFCPGGGGLNLTDESKAALQEYVRQGGGYVGVCGGAISAARAGLIEAERYPFGVRGPVWTHLHEHPVTEGYDLTRKLLFPHASGPLFVIAEDSDEQAVITFDVGAPPLPTFTHTIARQIGAGRVVVFSGHPEAAPETQALLRNAIMWVARIIGPDGEAPAP